MEVSTSFNTITIKGNIKTISDYDVIVAAIEPLLDSHRDIVFHLIDSISLTSSVIRYLHGLTLKKGIGIQMHIADEQLFSLLEELGLTNMLQVRKFRNDH